MTTGYGARVFDSKGQELGSTRDDGSLVVRVPGFTLPACHSLLVRNVKSRGMRLRSASGYEGFHREIGVDGEVEFADIPPGQYQLEAIDGRALVSHVMPVVIHASDRTVEFSPRTPNSLLVALHERVQGLLVSHGLRTGDVIVGLDGAPPGVIDRERFVERTASGDPPRLTIWRDGETFDVTLSVPAEAVLGGSLDPWYLPNHSNSAR